MKKMKRENKMLKKLLGPDRELKRPREEKSEFSPTGLKINPVPCQMMDLNGLNQLSKVPHVIREKIARDQFFELAKMYTGEFKKQKRAPTLESHLKEFLVKEREPSKKSEVFELLYRFGMFYLQVYPGKTASFLEYLHYLTTTGARFNVVGLMRLDSELRKLFLDHADWNWNLARFEVQNVLLEISSNPAYQLQSATASVAPKQQQSQRGSFRGRGRGGRGRGRGRGAVTSPTAVTQQRCIKWNEGTCSWGARCYPHARVFTLW